MTIVARLSPPPPPPRSSLAIVTSRQYFLVDTLSGVPAHNARQALVRIPMAGEELDHDVRRVTYRSEIHSRPAKLKKKNKRNIIEINSIISCAEKR